MLTLTQLRQNLFELADRVVDTGEALVIERRGVRLRLSRESTERSAGRLAKLVAQDLVVGKALSPSESPAQWRALNCSSPLPIGVSEPVAVWQAAPARKAPSANKRPAPRKNKQK